MAEESKKEKKQYEAVQVPTQHTPAIQTPEGEIIMGEQALAMILNELSEIKNTLV